NLALILGSPNTSVEPEFVADDASAKVATEVPPLHQLSAAGHPGRAQFVVDVVAFERRRCETGKRAAVKLVATRFDDGVEVYPAHRDLGVISDRLDRCLLEGREVSIDTLRTATRGRSHHAVEQLVVVAGSTEVIER